MKYSEFLSIVFYPVVFGFLLIYTWMYGDGWLQIYMMILSFAAMVFGPIIQYDFIKNPTRYVYVQ